MNAAAGAGRVRRLNPLAPLAEAWRARVARWVRRRQGVDLLPVTLARRRLYILPTRFGVAFAFLLLLMLIAGINYANSLALFLTFFLTAFTLLAMQQVHRNLLGVSVLRLDAPLATMKRTSPAAAQKPRSSLLVRSERISGRESRRPRDA